MVFKKEDFQIVTRNGGIVAEHKLEDGAYCYIQNDFNKNNLWDKPSYFNSRHDAEMAIREFVDARNKLEQECIEAFNRGESQTTGEYIQKLKDKIMNDNAQHTIVMPMTIQEMAKPNVKDVGWGDYVLSLFDESELYNGNPTLHGLRRVAEIVLGDILDSTTQVIQCPSHENNMRATVVCNICFFLPNKSCRVNFSGAADAYPGNLGDNETYHVFPVAMAEARAESRALRKALRLKKVSADELPQGKEQSAHISSVFNSENAVGSKINDAQLNLINTMSKSPPRGMNVDMNKLLDKLLLEGKVQNNKGRKLTEEDGAAIIGALSEYQQKGIETIPAELVGYQEGWEIL